MKRFLLMLAVVAAGLLIGSAALMKYGLQRAGEGQTVMDNPPAGVDSPPSLVNWVQTPTTVAALYETADLVVRGRIITQTEWYSSQTLPVYRPVDGAAPIEGVDNPQESAGVAGENIAYTPFTTSEIEVLETLKGESAETIAVSQVGGTMPDEAGEGSVQLVAGGNPILSSDNEYILFLTATTQTFEAFDAVYYLVHPAGGFAIRGEEVSSPIAEFTTETAAFPQT